MDIFFAKQTTSKETEYTPPSPFLDEPIQANPAESEKGSVDELCEILSLIGWRFIREGGISL